LSFPANRDGWVRTIKDLGFQFDFVSSDEVEQGKLASRKYKVLILPFSLALSPSEVRNIESFAQAGGTVIADAGIGLMDQHCAWREDNSVNELFGFSAPTSNKRTFSLGQGQSEITAEGAKWRVAANEINGLIPAEPYIKATTGTPLARVVNTDTVIAHRLGSGWVIYLNTFFDKYPKLRANEFGGSQYRALVDRLLDHAGLRPAFQILSSNGARITQAQVARYSFGNAEILAIVKDNVAVSGLVGRDGVTIYNDATLGQVARQQITIKLPKKAYVTDVRTGKGLGFTDVVHTSIVVGDAAIFGFSPSENQLTLSGSTISSRGEPVALSVSSSGTGPKLVRCHVLAPNGSMLPIYARNLLIKNSAGTFVFPSAFNDAIGTYTVVATDVVTGTSSQAKITLR
jgi:hypothetical protein